MSLTLLQITETPQILRGWVDGVLFLEGRRSRETAVNTSCEYERQSLGC